MATLRTYEVLEKQRRLFRRVYFELDARIEIFTSLPIPSLDRLTLQCRLDEIGKTSPDLPPEA